MRILDELYSLVGQIDAQVVAFLRCLVGLDRVVIVDQFRLPLVGITAQDAIVAFKPGAERPAVVGSGCRLMFGR